MLQTQIATQQKAKAQAQKRRTSCAALKAARKVKALEATRSHPFYALRGYLLREPYAINQIDQSERGAERDLSKAVRVLNFRVLVLLQSKY